MICLNGNTGIHQSGKDTNFPSKNSLSSQEFKAAGGYVEVRN